MRQLILIAEDEYGLAEVVSQLLSERGHDVDVAINGEAALMHMAARRPDLVLMDLMMPLLDGAGLVREMRSDPRLRDVPVVLMTSLPRAIPSDIAAMVQFVLLKPFTPDALTAAIDSALRRE
ncbi:MAG TPA: response regulator [Kofleriaceae bacterium]|nr:response regulator [Kofleriaceae bacterium]